MRLDDHLEALLAQMTLEEKIGQLGIFADMLRPFAADVNPEMNELNAGELRAQIRAGRVGAVFNGVGARQGRESQRIAVEESRLGIPLLMGADVIHGMRTVFPIPLGEAASFEPALAERTARAAAIEAASSAPIQGEAVHQWIGPMMAPTVMPPKPKAISPKLSRSIGRMTFSCGTGVSRSR